MEGVSMAWSSVQGSRYGFRFDGWLVWLLALCGITRGRSAVTIEPSDVDVRFGWAHFRIPRACITTAQRAHPSWQYGIGIHTNCVDWLCVNGSLGGMVELSLSPPQRYSVLLIPVRCKRFLVSLEDPNGFLQALGAPSPGGPHPAS
jgi:hypothetical protein